MALSSFLYISVDLFVQAIMNKKAANLFRLTASIATVTGGGYSVSMERGRHCCPLVLIVD